MLPYQNAREEPHRGSRVSGVQRAPRHPQSVDTSAGNQNASIAISASSLDLDSQSLHTVKRALAIHRRGIIADFTSARCQRGEDGVTM